MPKFTYAETADGVLFREADKSGGFKLEIWRPATKTWQHYADRKDYSETGRPISEDRAREIMGEAGQ